MNFSWLEDFLALAATGNFSRAADERHMTQPAFSRRIRALEEWLGAELFDRSSQPARLTEAGEWFRGTAQELLARVARVPGEARAVAEAHSSTLRFAATHALSFTFMPGWLRGLESRTAVGPVRLVSDVLPRCEALLMQSQVQFLLCHAHPQAPGALQAEDYPSVLVGGDVLLPVCAADGQGRPRHPLPDGSGKTGRKAAGRPAKGAAAAPVQLLRYSPESGIGHILHEVHGPALDRLPAQTVFTAHLASVLRTMVLDGRGVAWLPQTLVGDDLASGKLVEAGPAAWRIAMEVRLYRDRATLGKAGEAFWAAAAAGTGGG
ncbi:MAG: LysR family transcriptional regulator [Pseudomonadota bacterium]